MKNEILSTIERVLFEEASAIDYLAKHLNEDYIKLVNICESCSGKIILTGMGKSGHVAKKISATMASLGMASFFLHPAEAAHGDLGMVQYNDVVIMISKSGETDELIQLLPSLKIIGCKLIGIFCKEKSTLAKNCDLSFVLPLEKEACINNLAPTTSTTLTMAVGDAIAVAVSQKKGFGKNQFALFHPRGTLGKQLLLSVEDIANNDKKLISIGKFEEIKKVLWIITKNRLGAVAVVDENNKLIGLVSDGDIRRAIERFNDIWNVKASDIMTVNPISVKNDTLIVDAFKIMQDKKISVLPIIDKNGELVDIVSFHDIIESGIVGGR